MLDSAWVVSQWIVDAALSLGWYLKDEDDRTYNLDVLAGLKTNEALVPFLWTYEVANGLVMAHRRKRLAESDIATPPMCGSGPRGQLSRPSTFRSGMATPRTSASSCTRRTIRTTPLPMLVRSSIEWTPISPCLVFSP